jgi:uncharacterized membrane protein
MFKEYSATQETQELEVKVNILDATLILHALFTATYVLSCLGIEIPLLRQTIGLFYSLFIPGMLLMLTLKIKESNYVDLPLYCVGLSLSSLMLLGLVLNFAGPLVGIARPLSIHPTCISVIIMITGLWILCKTCRRESTFATFRVNKRLIPWTIVFLFPIFMSVFGAYLVYYEDNNLLLMVLLPVIALMAFSSLLKRLRALYPLVIFVASISLIYHIVLSSPSFGGDAYSEYGFSNLVLEKGIWDPSAMANSNNAVASINVLVPVLCQLNAMSVLQAFKVLYPIIFSLVPLALFSVLKKQMDADLAFLSAYLYISVRFFYAWVSEFIKQGFAMFFLMLTILILISREAKNVIERLALVFFSFCLIVSHYGVSYLFLLFIPVAYVFQLIFERDKSDKDFGSFLLLYVVLTISWYMYISSGCTFETIVSLGERIISNINELLNPATSDTLALLVSEKPFLSKVILKGLYLLTNALIGLGLIISLYNKLIQVEDQKWNFHIKYLSFSIPSAGFLIASLLPYVTKHAMDISRSYCVTLLFLAPFCTVGFMGTLKGVEKVLKKDMNVIKALAIFFAIFLLFNSGWVTEITGEKDVGSVAISQARIKFHGTPYELASLYTNYFAEEDIASAIWLSKHRTSFLVSSDFYAIRVLASYGMFVGKGEPQGKELLTPDNINYLSEGTYVYLRKLNWEDGIMTKFIWEKDWIWNTPSIMPQLERLNLIYSNGGSIVFFKD